ncbi:MAG: hypothetical protein NT013_00250 [Planctomycetia bacterium]|nr:hypothetical protein [Planctomycetia bacterium]
MKHTLTFITALLSASLAALHAASLSAAEDKAIPIVPVAAAEVKLPLPWRSRKLTASAP